MSLLRKNARMISDCVQEGICSGTQLGYYQLPDYGAISWQQARLAR